MIKVCVQPQDFDPGEEIARLQGLTEDIGAVATFSGVVRGEQSDDQLVSMTLEHYPGMTDRILTQIAQTAAERWHLSAITIVHRFGTLVPGDQIVFVGTAARHRGAAFQACAFVMDFLKTQAPFWKLEKRKSGERWVERKESDVRATETWDDIKS